MNFFHDIQIIYAVRLDPLRLSPMFFLDSKEPPVYDVIRLLLSYHLIMRATSPKILSLFFFALLSQLISAVWYKGVMHPTFSYTL
jgi:hypothetical protein